MTLLPGDGIGPEVTAMQSGVMMLRHLELNSEADRLDAALRAVLAAGTRTRDLGGGWASGSRIVDLLTGEQLPRIC